MAFPRSGGAPRRTRVATDRCGPHSEPGRSLPAVPFSVVRRLDDLIQSVIG
jgi:hypothetical protein